MALKNTTNTLNTLNTFNTRLELFRQPDHRALLTKGLRGIEREALRVNADGHLNLLPHSRSLGSKLTHGSITTDYSESLMEFITPASCDASVALDELDKVHRFVNDELQKNGGQQLWSQSMPCVLPSETEIPIAWYGRSHIGMLKHVYRRGLALRYGKAMQCIAGIHYNFSMDDDVWKVLHAQEPSNPLNAQDYQSEAYVAMIRNFHRYSWLLMYLFGASPALSTGFLRGREHGLETLSDDTLYLPYATSLRMSDLGYQNNAQDGLVPPYNTLLEYMQSLSKAVRIPYAAYEKIGTQQAGEWVQINTNVLQIENEFYATIRPKRVINSGERPVQALCERGVQYIEVRCMDVDPFESVGISLESTRFLDAFLWFCALTDSPLTNDAEGDANTENFARTVKEGRRPDLTLMREGSAVSLRTWGLELIEQIAVVASLLDEQNHSQEFTDSLNLQKEKLLNPALTPSARVLDAIRAHDNSFIAFGLAQSRELAKGFAARPLSSAERSEFERLAQNSLDAQDEIERTQVGSFDDFLTEYRSHTSAELCC